MAHDIESDYKEEYWNEDKRCPLCDSCREQGGVLYCSELEMEIKPTAHCDFFRSKN